MNFEKVLTLSLIALFCGTLALITACARPSTSAESSRITIENVGFKTPESVEYYAAEDVYLVTNINGSGLAADDNGFISKVRPNGEVIDLKWIDATDKKVRLDAPKGAEVHGDKLYVADLGNVHVFSLPDGAQLKTINVPGSTFLNGICKGPGDSVYVTDSGWKLGADGQELSGTDAIYQVWSNGKIEAIHKDPKMGRPNGIIKQADDLVVVTFESDEVFKLKGGKGEKAAMKAPPKGTIDGILLMDDGSFVMSSWAGSAIYQLNANNTYETLLADVDAPADLGFDTKRKNILIPLFKQDKVVILPFKK